MIKRTSRDWIPFWGDKWLFGSMRQEFDVAERGIWWDLMSIAMKDEGFIRANEDTPYPIQQLSGMLIVPEDLLKKTIEKFIKKAKYTKLKNGTLYITNWNKYCFTDRHMRRFETDDSDKLSAEKDTMSETEDTEGTVADTRVDKIRVDKRRVRRTLYSEQHSELATLMESKIKERLPRYKFMGKRYLENWANEFRLMEKKKEATISEIKELIIWIYKDDFWYKNILSAEKFRKQFGTRWEDMKDDKKKKGVQTREEFNTMQKKALEGK